MTIIESAVTDDTDKGRDALTGLASRVGLESYLCGPRRAAGDPLCLMAIEMARFGSVNDSVGAELGDKIIVLVSRRLRKVFAHAAVIARTHGDHFCLVFEGAVDLEEQTRLLLDFTQRPLAVRGEIIVLSVRLGIAALGEAVHSPDLMLHAAEVALHRAKRDRLMSCRFRPELSLEARSAHQLENDLRLSLVTRHAELHQAISNDEFQVLYQPIVDAAERRVHALEALIRWHHPKRGLVPPAQFIPMAEQIQVMDVLGGWIIRRACMDALSLPANADGTRPGVSINVSPTQFASPALLVGTVRQAIRETAIDPERVKIEITESTAFGADRRAVIEDLRALGCRVALDDFGTGYSSITRLNTIPLDYLKLDRSFIAQLGSDDAEEDRRSDRLTRAVLSIARTFELEPVVEGVETEAQCSRLLRHGARLMQGYLFSRPVTLSEACRFIARFPLEPGAVHG